KGVAELVDLSFVLVLLTFNDGVHRELEVDEPLDAPLEQLLTSAPILVDRVGAADDGPLVTCQQVLGVELFQLVEVAEGSAWHHPQMRVEVRILVGNL